MYIYARQYVHHGMCVQLYIYGSDKMSFTAILETVPGKNQKIKFYRPPELQKEVKTRK